VGNGDPMSLRHPLTAEVETALTYIPTHTYFVCIFCSNMNVWAESGEERRDAQDYNGRGGNSADIQAQNQQNFARNAREILDGTQQGRLYAAHTGV